ncbi:MAG: hypothetical protein M1334_02875, partial [Patescibacteria group bacterium]|nr:hypothetical protein [Patescibacteria group bacterium]
CPICGIKFGLKDKEATRIAIRNDVYIVHSGCARNFFGAVMKKYSKNKRNWLVFSRKNEQKSEPQNNYAKPLSKTDPIQIPCDGCHKPITLEENFVSFRKEFGDNYKGCHIYNYYPDCLSKEAEVKIYQHYDSDRHWYIFVSANTVKK